MAEEAVTLDQTGRVLGPRALRTRARLLAATRAQLGRQRLRELSVVDIAREAGTSPATFYQYFADVSDAVLLLAEQVSDETAAALAEVGTAWTGEEGLESARAIANVMLDIWDAHRPVRPW